MFDLASVLNQAETIDLALLYDRFALALRPKFPLAQLLLADVLSAQNKPEESLAVLARSRPARPITGRRGCARAINLDTLDRSDEAIAQLKAMTTENTALSRRRDAARRYPAQQEALRRSGDAYDEAIRRAAAAACRTAGPFSTTAASRSSARANGSAPKPICSARSS